MHVIKVTHGFDNRGRLFDPSGNLVDWWGNASTVEFSARSQCFRDEYSAFSIHGHQLNGLITLGENIADNGGVRVSYAAYEAWRKTGGIPLEGASTGGAAITGEAVTGTDEILPGLDMSHEQQYFLAVAQIWCGSATQQRVYQDILTNPHTYRRYRVNGMLQNIPEFARAFGCAGSAALNPTKKCSLW